MVRKILIIFLITISLFLVYCNERPSKPKKEVECKKYGKDVLLPSKLENNWQFQLWRISDENTPDTVLYYIKDTLLIEYNGKNYQCFIPKWNFLNSNIDWISYNGSDGLYSMGAICGNDTFISPIIEFKYPVNKGESWEVPQLVYNTYSKKFYYNHTLTITCLSIDQ